MYIILPREKSIPVCIHAVTYKRSSYRDNTMVVLEEQIRIVLKTPLKSFIFEEAIYEI